VIRTIRYDEETVIQVPVSQIEVENAISAGVQWKTLAPGLVPIFEEHQARLERNISLKDWAEMEEMEKAFVIAIRRNETAQKNLQADAEIRAAKRKAGRNAPRRR